MIKLLNAIVGVFIRKRRVDSWREKSLGQTPKNIRKGYWQDKSNILYFNHRR